MAAIALTTVFSAAALAVDLGALFAARRSLQGATDSAALAATYGLNSAPLATTTVFATNYLSYNGYPASQLAAMPVVTTGRYCPNPATIPPNPNSRFTPGTAAGSVCPGDPTGTTFGMGPNAVQVTTSIQSPLFFGQVVVPGTTSEPIAATATATQINEAGFTVGTGVASVSVGTVNPVLSALTGGPVSLTAAQYSGLVQTNVKALDFLNALSMQQGITAGSYQSLLQLNLPVSAILSAAVAALSTEGGSGSAASVALQGLVASIPNGVSLQVGQLLNLGVLANQGISSVNQASALSAGLNLYDLLTLSLEVANGQSAVAIPNSTFGIPGVASVTASSTTVEPPQSPPFVFGPVGVTVHTSQVRMQVTFTLLSALSFLGGSAPVTLPMYFEAGSGTATLSKITCGLSPATDAIVTISAQSGAGSAYIGQVSSSTPITNFSQAVTVLPATLATIGIMIPLVPSLVQVQITGYASAILGSPAPSLLMFNQTQIKNGTTQTVTSSGMTASLLQSLVTGLHPTTTATLLGAPYTLSPAISTSLLSAVATLLAPLAAGIDPAIDNVFAALGVKLGYMDVTVTGVRCGIPALVL